MVRQVHFMRHIHAGNFREFPFTQGNQRAVGNFRINVWRGFLPVFHPLVHVRDQRAPKPLDGIRIVSLLRGEVRRAGRDLLCWKRRGKMLESREKINTRIFTRPAPATWAITPSMTCRPCSSALKSWYKKWRRKRPLCEIPTA